MIPTTKPDPKSGRTETWYFCSVDCQRKYPVPPLAAVIHTETDGRLLAPDTVCQSCGRSLDGI